MPLWLAFVAIWAPVVVLVGVGAAVGWLLGEAGARSDG